MSLDSVDNLAKLQGHTKCTEASQRTANMSATKLSAPLGGT